ncbi:Bug family tripartite tricarboxylate transporter substrate binding protein [Bordetella pseudohinzii]|uniref:ABC transporter substrate-binding protein n=1 Tax=Bordetella pseudohinzii TaxID=1331258 RepID=A0A0J6BU11_9BORD|nr:tripartite tricarboxylate transporter substrate binding protein [Bordetella pseudohinzii]ANY16199.1 ABC transporter substrate-binding protein [Bordetella pseudohinzii]KMM25309.1 ABC transporter substrate-binding protein [Bordetella pseudohinzii]KXA78668.1 ABC transporter substrate-binding protein [Bordetella pseudohinzii]KXA81201.1 ABC transporter substrate-binding protein [Bordetella pseudohinzii]CUJ05062.1 Argininosuccinate lyase [Bordetella pseudohinzii]
MKRIALQSARILLVSAALAGALGAQAASYPDKPIKLVVPYPAGGSTDVLARTLGQKVADSLGQPVIVENRAGASGNIGAAYVAKSDPDGYTLFLGTSTALSVNQSLYAQLPYDAQKDFSPIVLATMLPSLVVVNRSAPARTMPELTAMLKASATPVNYASAGAGTPSHLGGELYKRMTGAKAAHIPYKGGAPALQDLVGGQTTYMFAILPEAMPLVRGGQLRALAVTTAQRLANYPDIPTVAESGVPGYELLGWYGFLAPAGTPADIVLKLNQAFNRALQDADTKKKLSDMGFEIAGGPPQKLADMMRSESAKWKAVIDEAGIKLD